MIIDLQRRIAEVGRIRIGQTVGSGRGSRPKKLDTFRLTSPDRTRIHQAAMLYGGQPGEWDAPAGKQWEVITEADALAVIVPPSDMAFSQSYELWSAGGCQRRCDGANESISDSPCLCDPDNRECKIHTRLSVMLRDLPGLGVWRIDTQGYYAAVELQGAVEVVSMAASRGQMLPARLRLEQRMIKRTGQTTKRFAVPVLDIEVSPAQLFGGGQLPMVDGTPGTIAIEPPRPQAIDGSAPLTPVPDSVPAAPVASVAEQATSRQERKPRKNAAQPVPRTGIKPRTAAQAAAARAQDEPPPPPPDEPPPPEPPDEANHETAGTVEDDAITKPQLQKLSILRQKEGYANDDDGRADWFRWVESNIGRLVGTNKDLTKYEASVLIDVLETAQAQDARR